jgi:type IV pilus assembly protein PilN
MSVRINLLPHRAERRKRSRQHFMFMAGVSAAIGIGIVALVHVYYAGRIATQGERNEFLKRENAKLDKEIDEIKRLKDEITQLIARKTAIEMLQNDRAQTVHLLEELVRQMPEGVYLKSVTQKGLGVNLQGYSQSNARVSTLMRNIEGSPWLASPELVEIQAATVEKKRVSAFALNLQLKRAAPVAKDAGKPAAKKG